MSALPCRGFLSSVFSFVSVSDYYLDFQYLAGFHHSFVTISITTLICMARENQLTLYFVYIIIFIFYQYFSSIVALAWATATVRLAVTVHTCRCPENLTLYPDLFHPYSIPGRPLSDIQFH